jgi:hypothetical protein
MSNVIRFPKTPALKPEPVLSYKPFKAERPINLWKWAFLIMVVVMVIDDR